MTPRVFAVILAAGRGRRMGRPKQLLPYRGATILETVVRHALACADSGRRDGGRYRAPPGLELDAVLLVTNLDVRAALQGRLPRPLRTVLNPDPDSEMIVSVQLALRDLEAALVPRDADGVMILLGDQPQVAPDVIAAAAAAYRAQPGGILIAAYAGRPGHPAVFAWPLIREVLCWPPNRRLNELAAMHPAAVRSIRTSARPPIDVNTSGDYEALIRPD